jgi:F0F1-type ATP synthase membrane subunit b/b'
MADNDNGNTERTPRRSNGYDGDKVKDYVARIENLLDEIGTAKGEYMQIAKARREDISEILTEARDAEGIPRKALKAAIRELELKRKLEGVRGDLEDEDAEAFDAIKLALGDFGDTELGRAALDRASV